MRLPLSWDRCRSSTPTSATAGTSATISAPALRQAHTGASQDVTAQQFGDKWPLTVQHAIIGCRPVNPPDTSTVDLFVNDGGTLYGLNGTALSDVNGAYQNIHAIWVSGMDITPLQDAARKLC